MSILAEVEVDPEAFLLSETIAEHPSMELRVIRGVFTQEPVSPFLLVEGEDVTSVRQSLTADESVDDISTMTRQSGTPTPVDANLIRVDWNGASIPLLACVAKREGALLRAAYTGGECWHLSILLPGRSDLAALHEEIATSFELRRISGHHRAHEGAGYGLTEEQREALLTTYQAGYFEIPRDRTLSEVADELDISANALSARLRRGFRTLVSNTLIEGG